MKLGYLTLAFSATTAATVLAFQPGEIPLNVAVRSTGGPCSGGDLKFFHKKDEIQHLKKKGIIPPIEIAEKRQSADDPLLKDYEPVAMSGGELKAFTGAGVGQ
ncbi:hypothetical protein BCR39DRAFT_531057 [Naematelia encephala]|uniref:Uncharacterized protein n=1 Tax=Naematelia encephala TaxID=71784 RepID=A0A1Y2B4Y0_9TREE|nr:hypothetical protein BCR39DRAFT_531057 [Naematelia encephala]